MMDGDEKIFILGIVTAASTVASWGVILVHLMAH